MNGTSEIKVLFTLDTGAGTRDLGALEGAVSSLSQQFEGLRTTANELSGLVSQLAGAVRNLATSQVNPISTQAVQNAQQLATAMNSINMSGGGGGYGGGGYGGPAPYSSGSVNGPSPQSLPALNVTGTGQASGGMVSELIKTFGIPMLIGGAMSLGQTAVSWHKAYGELSQMATGGALSRELGFGAPGPADHPGDRMGHYYNMVNEATKRGFGVEDALQTNVTLLQAGGARTGGKGMSDMYKESLDYAKMLSLDNSLIANTIATVASVTGYDPKLFMKAVGDITLETGRAGQQGQIMADLKSVVMSMRERTGGVGNEFVQAQINTYNAMLKGGATPDEARNATQAMQAQGAGQTTLAQILTLNAALKANPGEDPMKVMWGVMKTGATGEYTKERAGYFGGKWNPETGRMEFGEGNYLGAMANMISEGGDNILSQKFTTVGDKAYFNVGGKKVDLNAPLTPAPDPVALEKSRKETWGLGGEHLRVMNRDQMGEFAQVTRDWTELNKKYIESANNLVTTTVSLLRLSSAIVLALSRLFSGGSADEVKGALSGAFTDFTGGDFKKYKELGGKEGTSLTTILGATKLAQGAMEAGIGLATENPAKIAIGAANMVVGTLMLTIPYTMETLDRVKKHELPPVDEKFDKPVFDWINKKEKEFNEWMKKRKAGEGGVSGSMGGAPEFDPSKTQIVINNYYIGDLQQQ